MMIEQLRRLIQAVPFRPFVLYLADGRFIDVPHPANITTRAGSDTAQVMHGPSLEVLKLDQIMSVDVKRD